MKKMDKIFAVCFLASIVVIGGLAVYLGSIPKIGERFSEFYLTGSNGRTADYPTNLALGENGTVTIGIINHEDQDVAYKIVVTLDNTTIGGVGNIRLSNTMTWQQNYTFTSQKIGSKMPLEFQLYKEGSDEPYRNLKLWLTVRP